MKLFLCSLHQFILVNDFVQVTTPLLFKLIPAVINLGVLMHWFPSESTQNEVSLSLSLSHITQTDAHTQAHTYICKHWVLHYILPVQYGLPYKRMLSRKIKTSDFIILIFNDPSLLSMYWSIYTTPHSSLC